jgi:hypothetical protein
MKIDAMSNGTMPIVQNIRLHPAGRKIVLTEVLFLIERPPQSWQHNLTHSTTSPHIYTNRSRLKCCIPVYYKESTYAGAQLVLYLNARLYLKKFYHGVVQNTEVL